MRDKTHALDAAGNTTAAIGKVLAIALAALGSPWQPLAALGNVGVARPLRRLCHVRLQGHANQDGPALRQPHVTRRIFLPHVGLHGALLVLGHDNEVHHQCGQRPGQRGGEPMA